MFNQEPKEIIRVNRLPFFIGVVVLLLLIMVFMYKSQVSQKTQKTLHQPHQSMDISSKTVEVSWFNDDKFKNMRIIGTERQSPKEMDHRMMSKQESDLRHRELQDEYATKLEIQKIEDKNMIEEKKLEIEAARSSLTIDIPPPPGQQAFAQKKPSKKFDINESISALENLMHDTASSTKPSVLPDLLKGFEDLNNQADKQDFVKRDNEDDDYLEKVKTRPRSKYEVKAGSYIPAALITGINSDLPGNVSAQITENVYDSVTGNYLLIPQGAKLIGEYNSALSFGQQRVQVIWNRIIFPDGKNLDIQKMQGVDISGQSGFFDKVNNHYLRIYGNAVLLSLMGAGYDILNQKAEQDTDPRETVAAAVGQKLADVSSQALSKNMDVQPTLIIDPGYKFKIFVMKDMVLENMDDVEGTLAYTK